MSKLSKLFYILYVILKKIAQRDFSPLFAIFSDTYLQCKLLNEKKFIYKGYFLKSFLRPDSKSYNSLKNSTSPLLENTLSEIPFLLLANEVLDPTKLSIFIDSLEASFQEVDLYIIGSESNHTINFIQNKVSSTKVHTLKNLNDDLFPKGINIIFEPCWLSPDFSLRISQVNNKLQKEQLITSSQLLYDIQKDCLSKKVYLNKPTSYEVRNYGFNTLGPILYVPKEKISTITELTEPNIYNNFSNESVLNISSPLSAYIVLDSSKKTHFPLKSIIEIKKEPKKSQPSVLAIIPFKDQAELTLKAIETLKTQTDVELKIALVNNQSTDTELIQKIKTDKDLVLVDYDKTFNFSAMNNLAVDLHANETTDYILFLNNDIEFLFSNTLREMTDYAEDEAIGMVGIKLLYPDKKVQHGGVDLISQNRNFTWAHTDHGEEDSPQLLSSFTRITDGVTAACSLIKFQIFKEVNGFDSVDYPIAYSDTNLCQKIHSIKKKVLYIGSTYAIHHESASRGYESHEDFERSIFLSELNKLPVPKDSFYFS